MNEITIKLNNKDLKLLKSWCSVQRTINWAENIINSCDHEDAEECIEELKDIGPVLDRLHQNVKERIWEKGI